MKVLLIHNYYQSSAPSGEDIVFKNELELLENNGVEVITYERHNDEILDYGMGKKITLPFVNIWSKKTYREIKSLIKRERPDLCHIHNIFYLISPSAYYACRDSGVPVVQTLHNFRAFCANGLLYRNGEVCEECLGKVPFRGFIHGCFRNSRIYSLPVVGMEYIHKLIGSWDKKIDAFIALTNFGKKKFVEAGLREDRIFVKPNFLVNPPKPRIEPGNFVIFVGRLSKEKGLATLLEAWKEIENIPLNIIGDGPIRDNVLANIEKNRIKSVSYVGRVSHDEVIEFIKNSILMVFPSEWYEGFPMTLVEAYACGKPVVASRIGSVEEIVNDGETGLLFEPHNQSDLAEKVNYLLKNIDKCKEMGEKARMEFEEKYTPERNFEYLMNIYQKVLR
jgi:glycosyltransferase involved in cell wall biosynthesis